VVSKREIRIQRGSVDWIRGDISRVWYEPATIFILQKTLWSRSFRFVSSLPHSRKEAPTELSSLSNCRALLEQYMCHLRT
jgi:hypothetical protein